ncbi:MAG TPA: thioredoxin family protein [Chryseosolibacter sp.]
MKSIIFILLWIVPITSTEWLNDFELAKLEARQNNKKILLNFSGSDWCAPCIKLKRDVFEQVSFSEFATANLVLLAADFPRHKKNRLSDEQTSHNERLAELYNPQGQFPLTLLLDSDGKVIKTWEGFPGGSPEEFVNDIKGHLHEK